MVEWGKRLAACAGIFLLLPVVLTLFLSGKSGVAVSKDTNLEHYVAITAAMQVPWNMSEEVIKAQCVIARTNLYRELCAGGSSTLEEAASFLKEKEKREYFRKHFAVFWQATQDTEGQILVWQGEMVELPFFRVSAGKTRSGEEIVGKYYAYLPSVAVKEDLDSEEFLQGYYFTKEELEVVLSEVYPDFTWNGEYEIMSTDSAGYVMEIRMGNYRFSGEELRKYLELGSSCFSVQCEGEQVRFLCKGKGHGLGLSQYGANAMAENKKTYEEILLRFYPGMELTFIEK